LIEPPKADLLHKSLDRVKFSAYSSKNLKTWGGLKQKSFGGHPTVVDQCVGDCKVKLTAGIALH
jgi:hypothetical protein